MIVTLSISSLPSATGTRTRFGPLESKETSGTVAAAASTVDPPETDTAEEPVRLLKYVVCNFRVLDGIPTDTPQKRLNAVEKPSGEARAPITEDVLANEPAAANAFALGRAPKSATVVAYAIFAAALVQSSSSSKQGDKRFEIEVYQGKHEKGQESGYDNMSHASKANGHTDLHYGKQVSRLEAMCCERHGASYNIPFAFEPQLCPSRVGISTYLTNLSALGHGLI